MKKKKSLLIRIAMFALVIAPFVIGSVVCILTWGEPELPKHFKFKRADSSYQK